MTASAPYAPKAAASRAQMARRAWRIAVLRILLPGLAVAVFVALAGALVYNSVRAMIGGGGETVGLETLTQPRLIGSDDKNRPFVITAVSAARDARDNQKIRLEKPTLLMDGGQADETRMTAGLGVYDERTGRLDVTSGVKIAGPRGAFDTETSVFDTKTGEILGQGAVKGAGAFGTIQAGSYEGQNNGKRIIYKGGVRARLNMN